jgi:hypothetical protein
MLTTTLYHHGWDASGLVEIKKVGLLGGPQVRIALFFNEGPPRPAIQLL